MNIIKKLFGQKPGAESRPIANYVDQVRVGRDSQVQVAPATAFPFPEGINRSLAKLLSQHERVVAAYLVQMTYLDNPEMSPGDRPCLTLCLEYDQPDKALHDQISVAAQSAIDGKLGEWGFVDIIAAGPDILRAANTAARPFYMKQK
jgi:hypothetical protein